MTSEPSSSSTTGIDLRDALSILSSRSKTGGEHNELSQSTVPNELKEMGQTIDIGDQMEFSNKPPGTAGIGCDCVENSNEEAKEEVNAFNEEEKAKHEAMRAERARRTQEIQRELASLEVGELLAMIFRAQQERVGTYKIFEEGLSTILKSGNMTTYPPLCAKVTASFSVLSDTINAVNSSLKEQKRTDITNFITKLQKNESDKLNWTAALHLERLRLRNAQLGEEGEDERTVQLLKDGIQSLQQKIGGAVESINEVLEELRCIAADE